jgi:hypothetical protein
VEAGDHAVIGGFIVTGNVSKKVMLRAIGPSLQNSGISDSLADPVLELRGSNGSVITSNDNWKDNPDQAAQIQASGIPPQNDFESAIVATLSPANYTAIITGKNGTSGLGVVEVYDLAQAADARLANISTRGFVQTGNNVMIGGFILGGQNGNSKVLLRALGPSLSQSGVSDPLADPTLQLRDGNGALLLANDNWKEDPNQAAQITATGIAPKDDLESAIIASLPPAAYTAIVAGKNGGIGVGLVEVYNIQ